MHNCSGFYFHVRLFSYNYYEEQIYQLAQYIQEAVHREQTLEKKFDSLLVDEISFERNQNVTKTNEFMTNDNGVLIMGSSSKVKLQSLVLHRQEVKWSVAIWLNDHCILSDKKWIRWTVKGSRRDYSLSSWAPRKGRWLDPTAKGPRERSAGRINVF